MPGCYIHIPFCRKACHYCDFHFSTSLKAKPLLVRALLHELETRAGEWTHGAFDTLYFGGGTPSVLERDELTAIIDRVRSLFGLRDDAEITLEANPDDLTEEYLAALKTAGVNRLSVGIQSFAEEDLQFMNRSHSAEDAASAVKRAQDAGFGNITIDLIYGSPTTPMPVWEKNLATALSLNVPHISAYCLTVEPRTALAHFIAAGTAPPVDDQHGAAQFQLLIATLTKAGYDHYEISNFARPGFHSRHNSSYWSGAPYLGIGPSAHSFDGTIRRWNIANNARYVKAMEENETYFETEELSTTDRYNEFVMISLRTSAGLSIADLENRFGEELKNHFLAEACPWRDSAHLLNSGDQFFLAESGKLLADRIASDLFFA